jgi:Domain of unknown function (DUF1939)
MGVLFQGFFKQLPNNAVPSPADGNPSVDWWWDHLASQANKLRLAGFTAIWLPPVLKAYLGASNGADGYEPFDDYDIGSRDQKGSLPTRYGTREQLQRCVAVLRANGLDVYLDIVDHQRIGDVDPYVFRYPGADGTPDIGRFPKNPLNFLPQVPQDSNLGGPPWEDIAFGREFAPINASGPTQERWKDYNVFSYERMGEAHLLVGLNNDPQASRRISVATGFGAHVSLHDYTGHAGDTNTDGNGWVTITVPPNSDGNGFVCYSRTGIGDGFAITPQPVTQDFEGAPDLDLLPALNGKTVSIGRVWSGANQTIFCRLFPDVTNWTPETTIRLDLVDPSGVVQKALDFTTRSPQDARLDTTAILAGFYTLQLTASHTPPKNLNPSFKLSVTYQSDSVFEIPRS